MAVCSPFADADGQVKVSPSLRQLKRQVREAMEMREKAAELRHLRFGEDGAVVARTPGRAAVMLGRSGAPSADADLYVHMADAEMAFADECCAWCGAEECECEDEMCDGTMDGLSHAVASLAVDRAASGMAGLPKFEGQHLRFDDDGRALPAGGSSKLNGLPTPKGKHIVFDD